MIKWLDEVPSKGHSGRARRVKITAFDATTRRLVAGGYVFDRVGRPAGHQAEPIDCCPSIISVEGQPICYPPSNRPGVVAFGPSSYRPDAGSAAINKAMEHCPPPPGGSSFTTILNKQPIKVACRDKVRVEWLNKLPPWMQQFDDGKRVLEVTSVSIASGLFTAGGFRFDDHGRPANHADVLPAIYAPTAIEVVSRVQAPDQAQPSPQAMMDAAASFSKRMAGNGPRDLVKYEVEGLIGSYTAGVPSIATEDEAKLLIVMKRITEGAAAVGPVKILTRTPITPGTNWGRSAPKGNTTNIAYTLAGSNMRRTFQTTGVDVTNEPEAQRQVYAHLKPDRPTLKIHDINIICIDYPLVPKDQRP